MSKLPIDPPAWCCGRSREIFDEIVADLTDAGIVPADIRAVAVLADMQARFERCAALVSDPDRDEYFVNRHGEECEAPHVRRLSALAREMLPYFRQLGMTPAARKTMGIGGKGDSPAPSASIKKFNLKKVG